MNYYYLNGLIANSEDKLLKIVERMNRKNRKTLTIMIDKKLEQQLDSNLKKVMNGVLVQIDNVDEINYSYQNAILYIQFLRG